jgi:hypothetical protein
MGTEDDFFIADGKVSGFTATGDSGRGDVYPRAQYGHRTWFVVPEPAFDYGAAFQGWYYGCYCAAGDADDNNDLGPDTNSYCDFAGVLGTAVFVTGVAGTSTTQVGVYGQTEDDPGSSIPQNMSAGVFGAANTGSGVVGWSTNWNGVEGWAYQGTAVLGVSEYDRGVHGASTWQQGVQGWSTNDIGVQGGSGPEGTQGPPLPPNLPTIAGVFGTSDTEAGVIGTSNRTVGVLGFSNNVGVYGIGNDYAGIFVGNFLVVGGTKAAAVPFPDGTQRVLYCMESPELWFEDFGEAKLRRGRRIVKLDADFAKVIKRGDYKVFFAPEGDCRGLYVRRKSAASFEVRELMGGKSNVAFSYRIVGRRKDIKSHRRFAKIDTSLTVPATAARARRKPAPTAAGRRAFAARLEKKARERAPKGAVEGRTRMRAKGPRPDFMRSMQQRPERGERKD